jgi:hypothetical protein
MLHTHHIKALALGTYNNNPIYIRHLSAGEIAMDDDGALRCSSGGLSAQSH